MHCTCQRQEEEEADSPSFPCMDSRRATEARRHSNTAVFRRHSVQPLRPTDVGEKSLHHRWKHEIQIAFLRWRAAMTRAVLTIMSRLAPRWSHSQTSQSLGPCSLLTVETVTMTQTQGQMLPYWAMMMTMTSPLSLVNHLHHRSHQASDRPCSPPGAVVCTFSDVSRRPWVCFGVIADMIPRQLPLSVGQRINMQKCARFLTDLVAAAAFPPHTGGFALQLLGLGSYWVRKG